MASLMKSLLLLLAVVTARAEIHAVPHPACTFDAKHTVLWTPLFQAAWDALKVAEKGEGKAVIEPPNKVMGMLDGFAWKTAEVLPKDVWMAHTGPMNPELYNKANQEAKQRWGTQPFTYQNPAVPGDAALAMMERKIAFLSPFDCPEFAALKFQCGGHRQNVRFFGSLNARELSGLRVLHDKIAQGSFALDVRCKGNDESVIFYMPEKSSTFAEACQTVRQWRRREGDKQDDGTRLRADIRANESIRIPFISLRHSADFSSLLQSKRRYANHDAPRTIVHAQQTVCFGFDEKGVRSPAVVDYETDPFAAVEGTTLRAFEFDKPFFVFLWRDHAEWPYLAIWLGDTSAMHLCEE